LKKLHHMTIKANQRKLEYLNEELTALEKLIKDFLPEGFIIFECPECENGKNFTTYYIMDEEDESFIDGLRSDNEIEQWEYNRAFEWLPTYNRMQREFKALNLIVNQ